MKRLMKTRRYLCCCALAPSLNSLIVFTAQRRVSFTPTVSRDRNVTQNKIYKSQGVHWTELRKRDCT